MSARAMSGSATGPVAAAGEGADGIVSRFAAPLTDVVRRAVRALVERWKRRPLGGSWWRARRDHWGDAAQERYLRRAGDVHDVERRQRSWDRDEAGAYRLSGWR